MYENMDFRYSNDSNRYHKSYLSLREGLRYLGNGMILSLISSGLLAFQEYFWLNKVAGIVCLVISVVWEFMGLSKAAKDDNDFNSCFTIYIILFILEVCSAIFGPIFKFAALVVSIIYYILFFHAVEGVAQRQGFLNLYERLRKKKIQYFVLYGAVIALVLFFAILLTVLFAAYPFSNTLVFVFLGIFALLFLAAAVMIIVITVQYAQMLKELSSRLL